MILKNEPQKIITLGTNGCPNIKLAKQSNITLEDLQEKANSFTKNAKDYKVDTSKRKKS